MDKTVINLLAVIGGDATLKKVASTAGGEYHGPCPFCGGKDRFIAQPFSGNGGRWACRQCSPRWQDGIAYIMRRDGISFPEACHALRLVLPDRRQTQHRSYVKLHNTGPGDLNMDCNALKDAGWQQAAENFWKSAYDLLWRSEQGSVHSYLHNRGLMKAVYWSAGIGFNSVSHQEQWGTLRVWLPRGIVIPWKIGGVVYRINIRQFNAKPKYIQAKGGANGLYRADDIVPGCTVLMVEGEFDALAFISNTFYLRKQLNIVPVATGSSTGSRLLRWVTRVASAKQVLLAFDADDAGESAAAWWAEQFYKTGTNAIRLRPTHHDITDMWHAGDNLETWIAQALNPPTTTIQ